MSLACGDAMNEIVTNVVLRDDLVCRASTSNVVRLVELLNSKEVSKRTRTYIDNDLMNLRRNWASLFFIKSRPVHSKIFFHEEVQKVSTARSWLISIKEKLNLRKHRSDKFERAQFDQANGLWLPGKIVHVSNANRTGQLQACFIDRTALANIELQTHMLSDHRGEMYFRALVQLNFFGDRIPKPLNQVNFSDGEKCACCSGEFLWNSLLKGEPHVWLGKRVCKRCAMFVCDACSRNSRALPENGFLWPARICDRCFIASGSQL